MLLLISQLPLHTVMDEFAQTRGADDLFDDDFTPIVEPTTQTLEPQPQLSQRGGRNAPTPRGRGCRQPSLNTKPRPAASERNNTPSQPPQSDPYPISPSEVDPTTPSQQQPPPPQQRPPTAVRGDRTATGGIAKPKLTEDELSARLAAAKLNNAKRAEAHRLAEADEASFQQREAQASQKRKEEGVARRAMNAEREKNRLRKLGQQAGREWDEGKEEQEASQGSQYRRGAHGGVAYDAVRGRGARNGYQDDRHNPGFEGRRGGQGPGGRGRGDRIRGGRGRGESNQGAHTRSINTTQKAPDPEADFPALPTASKKEQPTPAQPSSKAEQPHSLGVAGGSWADEVQETKEPQEG